jgi:hypothetical protein
MHEQGENLSEANIIFSQNNTKLQISIPLKQTKQAHKISKIDSKISFTLGFE